MRNHQTQFRRTPASAAALALPATAFLLAGASCLSHKLHAPAPGTSLVSLSQSFVSLAEPERVVSRDELNQSKVEYALTLIAALEAQAAASRGGAASVSSADLRQIRGALKAAGAGTAALADLP